MSSNSGPHASRISPRKFSEKIALLNKKEREANAKFEEIIKEVQATRSQPQETTVDSAGNPAPQLTAEELQSIIQSTRYQAAHSDSLEEIEKVYENLMRCVGGQVDYQAAAAGGGQRAGIAATNKCYPGQQQFISVEQGFPMAKGPPLISMTTTSMIQQTTPAAPYYSSQGNNGFQSTTIDLNNNNNNNQQQQQQRQQTQRQQVSQSVGFIPCQEPIIDRNHFASHNPVDVCVSSSYLAQAQQQEQQSYLVDSQTRARVASFGSASRQKYRCSTTNNHQSAKAQAVLACDQSHPYPLAHHQYQTQYLKEPSGDRSRQKSCSDPQLHLAQPTPCPGSNNLCALGDCQALGAHTADNTHAGIDCCENHEHFRKSHQPNQRQQYKQSYFVDKPQAADNSQSSQHLQSATRTSEHLNPLQVSSVANNQDCGQSQVSTSSQLDHQHHEHQQQQFIVCDTTNTRGDLPNIKICAIEDNDPSCTRMILGGEGDSQNDVINSTAPSSRDGSLPDISNLQFGNNSAGTSPERHYHPPKDWPTQSESCYSMGHINTANMGSAAVSESCQALDGSWTPYECGGGTISMDAQSTTNQPASLTDPNEVERQRREGSPCWPINNLGQTRETLLKAGNPLSHSDCGFNTTNSSHHAQGNLMICTSSDLYNNIFRSHSHSNIDYLAKQNNATKRPHLYADNNLQQFEEHHTSQYCLQATDQHVMNVRRISELKAQGTSTSPLNSSSNLNSPQSEVNSPGSSTTEQCESTMIFANTPAQATDYYPGGPMPSANETGPSPDEPIFVQYVPGDATMIDSSQQQQARRPNENFDPTVQSFQGMQVPARQSYTVQQEALMCQQQQQPATVTTACTHDVLYTGAISPPTSTTDRVAFVNNEDNTQQQTD